MNIQQAAQSQSPAEAHEVPREPTDAQVEAGARSWSEENWHWDKLTEDDRDRFRRRFRLAMRAALAAQAIAPDRPKPQPKAAEAHGVPVAWLYEHDGCLDEPILAVSRWPECREPWNGTPLDALALAKHAIEKVWLDAVCTGNGEHSISEAARTRVEFAADALKLGLRLPSALRKTGVETPVSKAQPKGTANVDWLPHDNTLRFVQRVLEGDAPREDRDAAAQMVRDLRVSLRPVYTQAPAPAPSEPAAHVSSVQSGSPLMCGLTEWERKGLVALYTHPAQSPAVAPEVPGFSPMWLAPLDGTPVMLYMPTTSDKFAVGQWHGSPDSLHGNWGDDEGNYYVHDPVCFMALSNLERLVQPSFKPPVQGSKP